MPFLHSVTSVAELNTKQCAVLVLSAAVIEVSQKSWIKKELTVCGVRPFPGIKQLACLAHTWSMPCSKQGDTLQPCVSLTRHNTVPQSKHLVGQSVGFPKIARKHLLVGRGSPPQLSQRTGGTTLGAPSARDENQSPMINPAFDSYECASCSCHGLAW